MEINVSKLPESKKLLIPVASQNIPDGSAAGISIIRCGDRTFSVTEHFDYGKKDLFPYGMFELALGFEVEKDTIWNQYEKSERILFFICEEIIDEKMSSVNKKTSSVDENKDDMPDINA